jgi:hypothetical protein
MTKHGLSAFQRVMLKAHRSEAGCLEFVGARNSGGYGVIGIGGNRVGLVHRIVFEALNGPIPRAFWVLHHCDNPPCVEITHLYLGTAADNSRDMVERGRNRPTGLKGERNPKARLSDGQVAEIRASSAASRELAVAFGVSAMHIWRLRTGRQRQP